SVTNSIKSALEKDARVVVVLYQRLWGTTATSEVEAAGVKARIGKVKHKDVLVIPLDTSSIPSWLKGTIVKPVGSPTGAAVIDAIVQAVGDSGGTPKRITDAAVAARVADEEQRR